jgi:hypothetical protein
VGFKLINGSGSSAFVVIHPSKYTQEQNTINTNTVMTPRTTILLLKRTIAPDTLTIAR